MSHRVPYEKFQDGTKKDLSEEVPFDIPDSWALVRLRNISNYGQCTSVDVANINPSTWSLDLEEIEKGSGRLIERKTVAEKESKSCKHVFAKGMLLYSKLRTYLNKVLVADMDGVCTSEIVPVELHGGVDAEYLRLVLMSPYFLEYTASKGYGVKMPRIGTNDMRDAFIPLPPHAEQKRIVAKVEELFAYADKMGAAVDGLERAALRLDKKILDLAIRGKLVPQDPTDEPASELLKRVAAERKALVKAGKLKAGKSDSIIFRGSDRLAYETRNGETVCIQDEIPFDIPDSWEWVRLGTVLMPMETKLPQGEWFDYIDIDAIDNKQNIVISPKRMIVSKAPSRASRGLETGDTLFSVVRPYLRNIAYVDETLSDCIASTGFYVCRPCEIHPRFLFWLLLSDYVVNGINTFMKGDNSPSVRASHIRDLLVPIPPLAEQKRIVAKVEKLKAQIKTLTI